MRYCDTMPEFLTQLAQTPPMRRLAQVGMNCGCEYTSFYRFTALAPYSRLTHSIGVAQIVWHFTHDAAQSIAGLFHDISSPVFAHVVDFMNGDYLKQESTEAGTEQIIDECAEIQKILRKLRLTTDDVSDYHRYPLADNDAPRLSADRLEYTLGNFQYFSMTTKDECKQLYDDLTPYRDELAFRTPQLAERFATLALTCSRVYVSDEDRYAMQALAELLREAISRGVLTRDELWTTEPQVIDKLQHDEISRARWQAFRQLSQLSVSKTQQQGFIQIDAKKRYIDPLIVGQGRVSDVFPALAQSQKEFLMLPLTDWLRG